VHENDQFSTDVVNAAKEYAGSKGYEVVLFEGYNSERLTLDRSSTRSERLSQTR